MGIFRYVKSVARPLIDFKTWLDYKRLKDGAAHSYSIAKKIFLPKKADPAMQESFAQAMQRLRLTEEDVKTQERTFFWLAMFYLIIGIGLFGYFIYLAIFGHWRGAFIDLGIDMVVFGLAFRHHFWYFQTKNRVLGCTFREWLKFEPNAK